MAHTAGATPSEVASSRCPPGCVDAKVTNRVIAAAADLALVVNDEGIIQDVTIGEAIEAQPGWKKLLGRRWSDTIAKDSRGKVDQLLKEARAGEVTRSRELNVQTESGGEIPFRFSAVLLDNEKRVVALGRDLRALSNLQQQMISAQQAMDREYGRLRQAETRYRLLFQVTAEGVIVADAASLKIVESNPAAAALLEESGQALQGRSLQTLFAGKSWPAVQSLFAALDAGGRPGDTQISLAKKGHDVTVSASVFRQSGSALLLLRLRRVGATQTPGGARGSRLLSVIEAMPEGFVVVGEDRRILSANAAFCDLVQQGNENQVVGQPLDRWLGRPGVDLNIMLGILREHGSVRNFATIVRGDFGAPQEAVVSAVSALDAKVPCLGFAIRTVSARLEVVPTSGLPIPRSIDQLRELVGRVSLKEIVRESADLIERLCIEAALKVSGDNRASAAQLLGLSRQGLYSKLRRHGLGDLDPIA